MLQKSKPEPAGSAQAETQETLTHLREEVRGLTNEVEQLKQPEDSRYKSNIWSAARDAYIAGLAKGQAGLLLIVVLIGIVLWRLPPDVLGGLANRILTNLINGALFGYVLFVATVIGWAIHIRVLRGIHSAEMRRISAEKTKLQAELGAAVESSGYQNKPR